MTIATLTPILAEIWLALAGLVLLMIGVFRGDKSTRLIITLTVAAFAVALLLVVGPTAQKAVVLNGLFITDTFAVFMKALILIGAGLTLILDRKSTRLNSSHVVISYAVFCLKKKTHKTSQDSLSTTVT